MPPLLVLLGGLVLYCVTVAPTVLWGDDAELQRIVVTGEQRTIGQSGEASHVLWLWVTRAFVSVTGWLPLDAAGRTNLVSALAGAAALPFVYGAAAELARVLGPAEPVARRGAGHRTAGVAAAGAFAMSHTFWLLAVRPDVYTLQTALLASATWALVRWRRTGGLWLLALASLVVAAALLNHVMILASGVGLAAIALSAQAARRRTLLMPAAVIGVVGLAVLGIAATRGVPVISIIEAAASYRPQLPSLRDAILLGGYLIYQFPLSLPFALVGVVTLWRRDRPLTVAIALLYGANVLLMLLRHHPAMYVRDQYIFFLPTYVPVALLIGVGAAVAVGRIKHVFVVLLIAAPLVVYPIASATAGAIAARLAPARQLPGRDPVGYYLLPPKVGYAGARRFADAAFAALEPEAVVVSDWLPYQTLRYVQQVEGVRPDVRLEMINAGGDAQLSFLLTQQQRRSVPPPLYLADDSPAPYYEMEGIRRCFTVSPHGPLFRLAYRGGCF
ncbi:MAG: protein O-mannosyl-transferase family [Chloroflexota bacterium]